MSSAWCNYHGQTLGRILHFIYYYCGFNAAEHCTVIGNKITLYDEKIATIKYWGSWDVPVFEFYGDNAHRYSEDQKTQREKAIRDSFEIPKYEISFDNEGYDYLGRITEIKSFNRRKIHHEIYCKKFEEIKTHKGHSISVYSKPQTEAEREAIARMNALYDIKGLIKISIY